MGKGERIWSEMQVHALLTPSARFVTTLPTFILFFFLIWAASSLYRIRPTLVLIISLLRSQISLQNDDQIVTQYQKVVFTVARH